MISTGERRHNLCKSLLTSAAPYQHSAKIILLLRLAMSENFIGDWPVTKMAERYLLMLDVRGEHCRLIRSCPRPVPAAVRLGERDETII